MNNPTDAFTKNSFVDKMMKLIPDDPLVQAQYMYFLTLFVFVGLLGYALTAWFYVVTAFSFKQFFSGIFMTAISLISLFGLKQTRNSYKLMKMMYAQKQPETESIEQMQKIFQGVG